MSRINRLAVASRRFWFAPASTQTLAVYRIIVFGYLLCELIVLRSQSHLPIPHREYPFISGEWQPILLVQLLGFSPAADPLFAVMYWILVVSSGVAAIGFKTNWAAVVSALSYLYLLAIGWSYNQSPHLTTGLMWTVFALALSPCGRRYSIDALLSPKPKDEKHSTWARWPIRFTQITICWLYFAAGFAKLKAGWLWGFLTLANVHVMLIEKRAPFGEALAHFPTVVAVMQTVAPLVELLFPLVLFFPKTRWFFLPVIVVFHISNWLLMSGFGSYFGMWFLLVFFIDFEAARGFLQKVGVGLDRHAPSAQ